MSKDPEIMAKEVVAAGVSMSMSEARRLIDNMRVVRVCASCGACRCSLCRAGHPGCRVCGEKSTTIHRRGS
mgnify:FL=1